MAKSFKQLLGDDVKNTRTMLHEAIPITGTICSGTYSDNNIKTFSHGMFESVYDYPYLSSSANHIFDITYGCSSNASSSAQTQNAKKLNIYNQMAQVLMGYDSGSNIQKFDSDGLLDGTATGQMHECFFVNFSRLLVKDEIKKNSFRMQMFVSSSALPAAGDGTGREALTTIGDYKSATEFRTSPSGDYGLLFTSEADATAGNTGSIGLIFYQAGIAVITSSVFHGRWGITGDEFEGSRTAKDSRLGVYSATTASTIERLADSFRRTIYDVDFNNTIELNSTIYFCRVNHNEFNYSANPSFTSASQVFVKNNATDPSVTYATSVGLYSADNELLATAKLSEPLKKRSDTEFTLRVRLDY